ncbi:hypothetical protein [Azospirillum palustre]|uniref:hypothetical protein n=1 Tax=Azospirillum palustre TaxID=2044885 RepID=UPI0011787E48|nr:hypothetical protein [Azospirillum palustre]
MTKFPPDDAASTNASPEPDAASTAPELIAMSPLSEPALSTVMVPPVRLPKVMAPLVVLVLPAPLSSVRVMAPVPALIVLPDAMVMTAAPLARWASTTPLLALALAMAVKLPLSVVMLASRRMLRPADRVKAPPLPAGLLTMTSLETVMSLLACRVRAVPVLSTAVIASGWMVTV